MVHAETDSLLQMLKQAQKMDELLKLVKPDSSLSVSVSLEHYVIYNNSNSIRWQPPAKRRNTSTSMLVKSLSQLW